ncbi:MAG: precorrin-6y C5,15-methyltransferase (decarboxylating) subunit CbiE [Armatimonadota bacterium]
MAVEARPITIVGCGPGSLDCMTVEAIRAVESADVLVGAKRLLEMFPQSSAERIAVGADIERALDEIASRCGSKRIAVLVTGDPGLCSLAQPVIRRFGMEMCKVIPGISSVQVAFARVGVDWYGARIVSVHGRKPDDSYETLLSEEKIAILTEGSTSLAWVAELAAHMTNDIRVFVCEDLTLENERIRRVEPSDLAHITISTRTVVLLIKGSIMI